jgi:RHS repeat-associated protein
MPAPYTVTVEVPATIQFEGKTVELTENQKIPFDNPCRALAFVDAYTEQTGLGTRDKTAEGFQALRDQCAAAGGAPQDIPPPETPPAVTDPSTTDTGQDTAKSQEQETADGMGAPAPKTQATVESDKRQPGQSDQRQLSQQFFSQQDPRPDFDISDQLAGEGQTPDQIDQQLKKVQHNEPAPGEPHPQFGLDDRPSGGTTADPVILFTGQFTLQTTDLRIPSRGFPLQLSRVYRSGSLYFGPWGFNWDHNYNVYLRPLKDGGAAIWTGNLTEDVYKDNGRGGFEPPLGVFRTLARDPGPLDDPGRFTLTDRSGTQQVFERPDGWPLPERIPLTALRDRHGNQHSLKYDPEGRLARVSDADGRFLQLQYGGCGLLEGVNDHLGRTWRYVHDADGEHLLCAVSPPTPDFADGLQTNYDYDTEQGHPALRHNLIRVTAPDGRVTVENEYGDDPASDDFGRVVHQTFDHFEAILTATRLQFVPRTPDAINVPALRVESFDPGIQRVLTFNYRGDLLDERMRLIFDGTFRLVARTYRFDAQGNISERREPNGMGMAYTYDFQNLDPRARGNLLRAELLPAPTQVAASRIVQRWTYEPAFHRPKTLTDERGRVTTWVYDYELQRATFGDVVRIDYPNATLPDGTVQSRSEQFEYTTFGALARQTTGEGHVHQFSYFPSGAPAGYLSQITWDAQGNPQVQRFEYDAAGNRSAFIDGGGARTESVSNALNQVTLIRLPAVDGVVDEIRIFYAADGMVRREERPRGGYTDDVITDPFLANEFQYDTLGHLVAEVRGANTARPRRWAYERDADGRPLRSTDPLGHATRYDYDERGLLLRLTEAEGTAVEATWSFGYDINGNRARVVDPVGHRIDYHYDAFDRPIGVDLPGDAPRTSIGLTLNEFDRVQRVTITGRSATGAAATLHDSTTDYDERGRPFRTRLGTRSVTMFYDRDERVTRRVDQRNATWTMQYDGFNRVVSATDPLGNRLTRDYDAAGNLHAEHALEAGDGGPETMTTVLDYDARRTVRRITAPGNRVLMIDPDARGLPARVTDPLGQAVQRTFGLLGELETMTASLNPGVAATTRLGWDLLGRQVSYQDAGGQTTQFGYDERDRRLFIQYPDGKQHRWSYSVRQQPESEQTPGGIVRSFTYDPDGGLARVDFTAAAPVVATQPLILTSDGLRRPVRLQQGTSVVTRSYDQALRLASETVGARTASLTYDDVAGQALLQYPDGRSDRLTFDPLGRLTDSVLVTHGTFATPGAIAAGRHLVQYLYRGPGRATRRTLWNGIVTDFLYDDGARLTGVVHRRGTTRVAGVKYLMDRTDRRRAVWATGPAQHSRRIDYDGLSRVATVGDGIALAEPPNAVTVAAAEPLITAAAGLPPAATETFGVNASGARTSHQRTGANPVSETFALDADYRVQSVTRGTAAPVPFAFDDDGRCLRDDRFRYSYDALGRLVRVDALAGGPAVLTQDFDAAGRVIRRSEGGGAAIELVPFGLRTLEERNGAGAVTAQMTYGLGGDEVVMDARQQLFAPLDDGANTTLAQTDGTGAVRETYAYDTFGVASRFAANGTTPEATSPFGLAPRFGGHRALASGLYAARARTYDPRLGRFLERDPLGYVDGSCLYTYTHHDPVNFVDPTGEVGLLLGLAVAAGVGLLVGAGMNAVRQGIQIHEGSRSSFSFGELGLSAGIGMVAGPVLVVAPELAVPLAAYGVAGGIEQMSEGHWETGAFDVATSLLPFGFKGARSATFGRGSAFAPARGLGPSATAAARFGRFSELSRSTAELAGRVWNERLYRGTTYYEALQTEQQGWDLANVRNRQATASSPPRLGPGLYFTHEPGNPQLTGTAGYWADFHSGFGQGRGGGPAIIEASIPRWRLFLLRQDPGVAFNVEQPGFAPHPSTRETFFPFRGPLSDPPAGPAVDFDAAARFRIWDPMAPEPDLSGLFPVLTRLPTPMLNRPKTDAGTK